MRVDWIARGVLVVALLAAAGCRSLGSPLVPEGAATTAESQAAALFDQIADDPVKLRVFLREMPKGGDLHNHLSGTPYAEEFLEWAEAREFCIDVDALAIAPPPCDWPEAEAAADLRRRDPALYNELVDAMSVRKLLSGVDSGESGHKQFFSSFDRFFAIVNMEPDKALASSRTAAADDHVLYQELMYNPRPIGRYVATASDPDWTGDFAAAFDRFAPELPDLVAAARAEADAAEAGAADLMGCGTDRPSRGCGVDVYYNCYGLRLFPTAQLFRQLATCFALIEADPRFVGVSLVQPEDDPNAVADYDLHMRMVGFLGARYPKAKISLHAGELTIGLVPGPALRDHIFKAIDIAGSDRIGHGVGIAFERDSRNTLRRMARERIAVEVNLSSNDVILGVRGDDHPMNLYRASGVPIVLSTDDLGVLRTDMTEQYVRAAREHGLSYRDLKAASRNSLQYAFLPGASLWAAGDPGVRAAPCELLDAPECGAFVAQNVKAGLELKLEHAFDAFEANIIGWGRDLDR